MDFWKNLAILFSLLLLYLPHSLTLLSCSPLPLALLSFLLLPFLLTAVVVVVAVAAFAPLHIHSTFFKLLQKKGHNILLGTDCSILEQNITSYILLYSSLILSFFIASHSNCIPDFYCLFYIWLFIWFFLYLLSYYSPFPCKLLGIIDTLTFERKL